MKKKPNGFVSVLLALCLLLAPMTVFAESNAQLNYVTDDAGILTDSQWEDLEQRAQQVCEVRVAISDLAALKFEVLQKVGEAVGNIQTYQL